MLVALMCAAFSGTAWADTVTLKYSGSTTTNMTGDGNEAATVGLDADEWSVVAAKNSASNNVGLNSAGDIRLYYNASGSNTLSVSSLTGATINSIKITFTGSTYSNASVTVGGNAVTGTDGVYEINGTSFVIGNGNSSNVQVRISQIVIDYSTGGETPAQLEESDFALTGAPVALTFDLYDNAEAQVINYTTSSNGEVTVSASEYVSTVVGDGTITVTPLKKTNGAVEITVNQAKDDSYKAGSATFTVTIDDSTPKTGGWYATALADIAADDVFVIVGNNGSDYAMTNSNGTGSAPSASAVTVDGDELTSDVNDNMKWNLSGNATDGYTFYPDGTTETWLYCTNNNNGLRVGTGDDKTFAINDDYLYNKGQSRYVGVYNSSDWRSYTSINNNIKDQSFKFYKYVDASDTRAATEVAIDATGITNTNVFIGTAAGQLTATVSVKDGDAIEGATVVWSGNNDEVATIDATTGTVTLVAAGEVTFTATYAGDEENYKGNVATYQLTVVDEDPNVPGASAENPYTVAQAIDAIDNGGTVTGVYVTGIVSQVDSYSSSYHSITYWISEDGTTDNQFEVYSGKGIDGANFSSIDDIQVGDVVVVKGDIKLYNNSVYEFSQNSELVSLSRKEAATITVTGGTEFTIDRTKNEEELTIVAEANSGATVTFTVDTENTTIEADNYEFEDGLLVVSGNKGGVIVIKANAEAAGDYKAAEEVTITVTVIGVKEDAIIVVTDSEVTYGSTFTVDDSVIKGGDITVSSSNTAVATVEGLVITPAAVGTTTITVATAEDDTYKTGSETFTLTVTAPEGQTVAKPGQVTTTFNDKNLNIEEGGMAWKSSIDAFSFDTSNDRGVQFGAAKGEFTLTAENSSAVTKVTLVMSTNGTGNTVAVSVGEEVFTIDSKKSLTLTSGMKNDAVVFEGTGTGDIVVSINDANKSVYVKSITVEGGAGTVTTTLNASGYATFCSEYPLDFSEAEGYTSWQITDISDANVITFDKITGDIKGGQGVLLKGTAGATVTIVSKNSSNELSSNLLEGTLAPTYVAAGEYYGLSGDNFVKANAGTVKAGKAILNADWINESAGAKAFTFVFNDTATGVRTVETVSAEQAAEIFNLAGQRINKMQRGVNIVNGRKVLVK
ncbi:MAG: hypothetical protein IJ700_01790 [Bacteroidaceae bacterium]|nr:hypothetical protein [Bacteroidaceae bacterium]